MLEIIHRKKRLSSFKLIALGFAGVIVLGALILMLPFSSNTGSVTPFHEALFTSTSAVCVTGLVVQDTGSYWSAFGQAVILLLIQIGGLGVVTVAATFAMLSGRKISLMQRSTMQDAISPKSRRHRSPDSLYCTWDFSDRTYRNGCHATGILQRSRFQRNLDGGVSFGLRFLQCRIRHTRHHRKQISISYGIRRRADNKHCNYDFNYRGRHWLFDLG